MALNTWTQIGLDIDGEADYVESGRSVSLSADGTIVAIGAPYNDGNKGQVRVYQNISNTWTQIGQDIDGEADYAESGRSVSLSADGTILAIGAPGNSNNGFYSGQVRVYQYKSVAGSYTWSKIGQDIDGEAEYDQSGYSVSLSSDETNGTIVAIGAPGNSNNGFYSGQVRVYQYKSVAGSYTWSKIGQDIDGEAEYDYSGYSVSLSSTDGTIVAIGAIGNNNYKGQVRVYKNISNSWSKIGQDIDGEADFDQSGHSVSLSANGTVVAIGAPYNSNNKGQVRVYQYKSVAGSYTWSKIGQDIDGEAANDQFGYSVSINADGTIVAIGAPANNNYKGQVRVYKYISGNWTQIGQDIDGEASNDQSGYSVSLSSTYGNVVAIGAPYSLKGQVRVFEYNSQETPTITNFNIPIKTYGDTPFEIPPPTSNSDGAFTYTSSDLSVATIIGSIMTIVSPGTSTILATQAATPNYTSGTIDAPFQVLQNSATNPVNISNGAELTYFLTTSAQFANISTDVTIFDNLTASNDFKYIFNYSQDFINITRQ